MASRRKTGNHSGSVRELKSALKGLLQFVVSGRRYEIRNPYSIPEVQQAFLALGYTKFGHPRE